MNEETPRKIKEEPSRVESRVEFGRNPEPRVPVSLLLDCSSSMDGDSLREMINGVRVFKGALCEDALARKRVEVQVISFSDRAIKLNDFLTADQWTPPELFTSGYTAMGEALSMGYENLMARKKEYRHHGINYFRPWMLLITDGAPSDRIDEIRETLLSAQEKKHVAVFPVGVSGADMDLLSSLSLVGAQALSGLRFAELFQWLSSSLSAVSQSIPGDQVSLPSQGGWAEV